jgi:putative membrane protein insertion efficiency factor
MRKLLIWLVHFYQLVTSNFAPRCKYYPSCSNYAATAIGRYGFKGMLMAVWRIARCNPWSQGGIDYVDYHLDCADVKSSIIKIEKEVVGAI